MKKVSLILISLCLVFSLVACGGNNANTSSDSGNYQTAETGGDMAEGSRHLLIATTSPNSTGEDVGPYTGQKAIVVMKQHMAEISEGKLTAECSWGAALGNTAQLFAQTSAGDIDIHMCGLDTLTTLKGAEDTAVFSVPYLFDDFDHLKRYTDSESFANLISEVEEQNNLKWIGLLAPSMPRSLNTIKPISHPDDLNNMKIRVAENPAATAIWTAWGANPVVLPATEVYSGLENNLCDGWENAITAFYNMKTYEVAPYITEIDYVQQGICCFMSMDTWNSLSEEEQQWVLDSMDFAYENAMDISYGSGIDGVPYYEYEKAQFAEDPDCNAVFVEDVDLEAFQTTALEAARDLEGDLFSEGLIDDIRALSEGE